MIWLLHMFFICVGFNQVVGYLRPAYVTVVPCRSVVAKYEVFQEKRNQYSLEITLPNDTMRVSLRFSSEATLKLQLPYPTDIKADMNLSVPRNNFTFMILKEQIKSNPWPTIFLAEVSGTATGTLPYINSILINYNYDDFCKGAELLSGYFDEFLVRETTEIVPEVTSRTEQSCGRRKVVHTELIVSGQSSNPGDWPWHVAIFNIKGFSQNYMCGGTLLSKTVVLTAAHCASVNGYAVITDSLAVYLGKHNRVLSHPATQEKEVFEIVIHPDFNTLSLNHDIALLKLKTEAVFTDYVQPACLWHPDIKIPTEDLFGTVVGWGYNELDQLTSTLQQITIPIVSELTCLKSNPAFYNKKLDTNKFCAGFANGSAACNGDSGGGLVIQVSDSWYVRGIVSVSQTRFNVNVCDPNYYTIFTDVEKYLDWLSKYL